VQLAEVAVGENLATLYQGLTEGLDIDLARKLSDVIVETIGLPPMALEEPMFDLVSSLESIMVFPAEVVPTPVATAGTSDIKWTAYLDEADGIEADKLNRIFVGGTET
jgi:hypothetical protein